MLWELIRSISMSTHNICFHGEIRKYYVDIYPLLPWEIRVNRHSSKQKYADQLVFASLLKWAHLPINLSPALLAFWVLVKLHFGSFPASILRKSTSAVIGPSATLTGRWRPDIDLRRMLTGFCIIYQRKKWAIKARTGAERERDRGDWGKKQCRSCAQIASSTGSHQQYSLHLASKANPLVLKMISFEIVDGRLTDRWHTPIT